MRNASLITHRYVMVNGPCVSGNTEAIPAVWFAISSTPGRALGCHVLLESGAMVADLPLHWLTTDGEGGRSLEQCQAWDCFGYEPCVNEFDYLNLLECRVLDREHKATEITGKAWLSVDWIRNGWSEYPEQHKLMHVISCSDGSIRMLPTDRLLWNDASFTKIDGVPRILRQTAEWSVE